MELKIIAFGKIADITAGKEWQVAGAATTAQLREQLESQFPGLRGMTYQIAVDKKIAATDTPIFPQSEVALLPPFSGG